jgi:hypothetical protein
MGQKPKTAQRFRPQSICWAGSVQATAAYMRDYQLNARDWALLLDWARSGQFALYQPIFTTSQPLAAG